MNVYTIKRNNVSLVHMRFYDPTYRKYLKHRSGNELWENMHSITNSIHAGIATRLINKIEHEEH